MLRTRCSPACRCCHKKTRGHDGGQTWVVHVVSNTLLLHIRHGKTQHESCSSMINPSNVLVTACSHTSDGLALGCWSQALPCCHHSTHLLHTHTVILHWHCNFKQILTLITPHRCRLDRPKLNIAKTCFEPQPSILTQSKFPIHTCTVLRYIL